MAAYSNPLEKALELHLRHLKEKREQLALDLVKSPPDNLMAVGRMSGQYLGIDFALQSIQSLLRGVDDE